MLDDGEPGVEGWTIQLDLDSDGTVDQSTTTDADGNFRFEDVPAGTHTVSEESVSGWIQSFPTGGSYSVTVEAGDSADNLDFGNFHVHF